jgi:hypothetical protein
VVHVQADALIAPGLTFLILIVGTTVTVPTLNWAELAWSVPAAEAEAVAIAVMMRQVAVPSPGPTIISYLAVNGEGK